MISTERVSFAAAKRRSGSSVDAIVVGKFRPVPPECTEGSLTLLVSLKEHVLLVELLGLFADGQLDEGAAIQAQPAGALRQDLPSFVGDADG